MKLNPHGFAHQIIVMAFVVVFAIAGVAYLVASHADTPKATTASYSCVDHQFSQGSRSYCVKSIQYGLDWSNIRGSHRVKPIDGIFGFQTKSAVQYVQTHDSYIRGNYGKTNGTVDNRSWEVLCGFLKRGQDKGDRHAQFYYLQANCQSLGTIQ